ncbi:MAG TPA: TraB/GumN family protein [Sphingomicrobium sp.]|nr:TraB/GumN family protein [Sphingomicrobium sp.]
MTKKLAALLLGIALSTTPATAQQPAPAPTAAAATADADPALWAAKDKDTTIYLFGTVHVLKPGLTWFDDAVKKAFDSSDQLVLELVMPDPATMQALVTRMGMNQDATTLTDKLPAADRPAYTKALTDLGIPPAAFDHLDPWLAATELSILPLTKLGYTPANGPETVLTDAAKAAGKPVIGLETAEQQLGYLDGLPQAAQIAFLESTVKDVPKAEQQFDEMVADWSKGDPQALAKIMNDDLDGQPQLRKTLLTDRNARWADWIVNRMKTPGTVFIAVGAGHLAGEASVIDDLRARHVAVTRIAY